MHLNSTFDSAVDKAVVSIERGKSETKHRVLPSWRRDCVECLKAGFRKLNLWQPVDLGWRKQKNAFDADSNQSSVSSGKHNNTLRGSVITFSSHLPVQFRQPSQSFSPTRQSLKAAPLHTATRSPSSVINGPGDCFVATYRNHASHHPQTQTAVAGHGREAETEDPSSRQLSRRLRYTRPPLRQASRSRRR